MFRRSERRIRRVTHLRPEVSSLEERLVLSSMTAAGVPAVLPLAAVQAQQNDVLQQQIPPADFSGDGKTDVSVFRPWEGKWYILPSDNQNNVNVTQYGLPGDFPVSADYDGDGTTDQAVFRTTNGQGYWYVNLSSGGTIDGLPWGLPGDIPAPADFNTDGKADFAVFRTTNGQGYWYILMNDTGGGQQINGLPWGLYGDVPVPGHYSGNGAADVTVFRPNEGKWYVLPLGGQTTPYNVQWGLPGDIPVPGNYDGDGQDDFAVFRTRNNQGYWYVDLSSGGAINGLAWGLPGDIPTPGDYDGDGTTDAAVFRTRQNQSSWYILNSGGGSVQNLAFGLPGDFPAPTSSGTLVSFVRQYPNYLQLAAQQSVKANGIRSPLRSLLNPDIFQSGALNTNIAFYDVTLASIYNPMFSGRPRVANQ